MTGEHHYWYRCIGCSGVFSPEKSLYTCSACGNLFLVERDEEWITQTIGTGIEAQRHFDEIRWGPKGREYPYGSGVWMWLELILPGFPIESVVSLREGPVDLFELPDRWKGKSGLGNLFFKMEGQLPSGSFKDRGMTVAVSEAVRRGAKFIGCSSTGDTSAAAAVYAGYSGLSCLIFLPDQSRISSSQSFQAVAHGATVLSFSGNAFDECMNLIQEYCLKHPEVVLVNSKNADRIVGQETCALEICQDLRWKVPQWIAIPCGNGANVTSFMISLLRMKERGMIDKLPGLIVAQAEQASTLVRWGRTGVYEPSPPAETIASAIAIQDPVSFPRIRKLIGQFNAVYFDVSEDNIQATRNSLMGVGAPICPQTAVAFHAAVQAREAGDVKEDDRVVVVSTANALKFPSTGLQSIRAKASMVGIERALRLAQRRE